MAGVAIQGSPAVKAVLLLVGSANLVGHVTYHAFR